MVRAMRSPRFVLASASPRRATLLRSVGLNPEVVPSGIPEGAEGGETPDATVARLAVSKAREVARRIADGDQAAIVLAADTAVVLDDDILGKPGSDDAAAAMLRRLSGREHRVLTGVGIVRVPDGAETVRVVATKVRFRPLDGPTIAWYVSTREPMDKAGAYGIQGRGAVLVEGIQGSWSNVVGLPMERLPEMLRDVGVDALEWFSSPP